MAEYHFAKRQTARCDMKFSKSNYQIISKTLKTQFFHVLVLSASAQIDEPNAFFVDQIFKKTKNKKMGDLLCHTVVQGVFIDITLKIVFDSADKFTAGAANPLLLLQTIRCRLSIKKTSWAI